MKKQRKYDRVLSFGATSEQMDKLERVSQALGISVSAVVRGLIDSAIPDVDPTSRFWQACKNSGIFDINAPANTVVAFIASFFDLPLTGNNKIGNVEIKAHAPYGLSPTLWALKRIEEEFYEKGLPIGADKSSKSEDNPEEQRRTESNK